jgi:hypothetical protein
MITLATYIKKFLKENINMHIIKELDVTMFENLKEPPVSKNLTIE